MTASRMRTVGSEHYCSLQLWVELVEASTSVLGWDGFDFTAPMWDFSWSAGQLVGQMVSLVSLDSLLRWMVLSALPDGQHRWMLRFFSVGFSAWSALLPMNQSLIQMVPESS
jgi:hypothetical protein